jgi:putative flavoprotein involved in K+ transport
MKTTVSSEVLDVIVVGAGQAGLAVAYHLSRQGAHFLVLDAGGEVGESWRTRWDSLRLFTSAQYDGLPGMPFPARDRDYPTKDMVADYLRDYAARFGLPVRLGCAVSRVEQVADGFVVHTGAGSLAARQVVIATGPFPTPVVPSLAADLPGDVVQLHSAEYRRPGEVPAGPVVVVGSGNSGRQIAEELAATHDVTLAVGAKSLQLPQRFLGRDLFWWLTRTGLITKTAKSRLARRMRARGDLVIGTPLRRLRRAGVKIRPRVVSFAGNEVRFDNGHAVRTSTVVWATGFRADYSWVDVPAAFDAEGHPRHERGISAARGLAFIGLPWQHTRGSALLGFVRHDAAWVAAQLRAQLAAHHPHRRVGVSGASTGD